MATGKLKSKIDAVWNDFWSGEFVDPIIDELTGRGVVEARRVYQSPYDGLAPEGPEALFVEADLDKLFQAIEKFGTNADRRPRRLHRCG